MKHIERSVQSPYCGPVLDKFDLNCAAAAISAAWLDKPPWGIFPILEFAPICEDAINGGQPSERLLAITPVVDVFDTEVTEVEMFGLGDDAAELSSSGISESIVIFSVPSCFGLLGSYFLGLPRDRWRLLRNSASSTIQNEPKSSS